MRALLVFGFLCLVIGLPRLHHFLSDNFIATTTRTKQSRTTFDAQNSSMSIYKNTFDSAYSLLAQYEGRLETIWACRKDIGASGRKVVFVHVFKTAGSTFRTVFHHYSAYCHRGYALLIYCSYLSSKSLQSSSNDDAPWITSRNETCKLKGLLLRNSTKKKHTSIANRMTNHLLKHHVDFLLGHLPVGVHANWKLPHSGSTAEVSYITFVRDAFSKYVSGVIFAKRKKIATFDGIVAEIRKRVRHARERGKYHDGYSGYFLTPQQKDLTLSLEERTQLILENLLRYNILIGVVERMPQSTLLLQYLLDRDRSLDDLFNRTHTPNATQGTGLARNKSKISTSAVLRELEKDASFYEELREYLKYDCVIYAFAVQMHEKQHHFVQATFS